MRKVFEDLDLPDNVWNGAKWLIYGYGSQGHAHAKILKSQNQNVRICLKPESETAALAKQDGFEVIHQAELILHEVNIVVLLTPDETHAEIVEKQLKPYLQKNACVVVGHGFSLHYKSWFPREDWDVVMVAPKSQGIYLCEEFFKGRGVPGLVAIHQDFSGKAREKAFAYAKLLGLGRAGVLETTLRDEAVCNIFGEQAVLCGGVVGLMRQAFETLVEKGYPAEEAYIGCIHELKILVDLIFARGITGMKDAISNTAEFGAANYGEALFDAEMKKKMQLLLNKVEDGSFAETFLEDAQTGFKKMLQMRTEGAKHPLEETGRLIRGLVFKE